jgi:HlyD family secretion protein
MNVLFPGTHRQDRVLQPAPFWVRHRRLTLTTAALVVAMALLLSALLRFSGAQTSVDRSRLIIATVERGSFIRDVVADGQIVAAGSPTLYAPTGGNVAVRVHAGDAVKRDQVLAVMDSPDLQAKFAQEEATLESLHIDWKRSQLDAGRKLEQMREAYKQAEIDLKTAQQELDRSRKAYELGSYSELQVLKAQNQLEKMQFAYDQAKMSYDSQPQQNRLDIESKKALLDRQQYLTSDLRRQIESLVIRSPVTGRVGQLLVGDLANVAKDAPLLTVVDLSALQVEIKVPESLVRGLTSGMVAEFHSDARGWKGTVDAISPQVVNGEVTARLRFTDGQPPDLRQNQRLPVRIFIEQRNNVLMVDRGSFLEQDGGAIAYVVRDNIAQRRAVHLGAVSVQKVEILQGLREGDQVVVSGTDAFRGAQRIILTH